MPAPPTAANIVDCRSRDARLGGSPSARRPKEPPTVGFWNRQVTFGPSYMKVKSWSESNRETGLAYTFAGSG